MEKALKVGQGLKLNPYTVQMEKLAESLKRMSLLGNRKYEKKNYTEENILEITKRVEGVLCSGCRVKGCEVYENGMTRDLVAEMIEALDEYGIELNVIKKRSIQTQCGKFDQLKAVIEEGFSQIKKDYIWEMRMEKNKEASLQAVKSVADAIEEVARELEASIFQDERLEKKLTQALRKMGMRLLKITLMVSEQGQYEVQISAKAKKGGCVEISQIADVISTVLGHKFVSEVTSNFVLQEEYTTVIFIEKPSFQTIYGVAKKEKDGSEISGDNFLVMDIPGGKKGILISDGMGSGEEAFEESGCTIEAAEELLETGISAELVVEMLNAMLVSRTEEERFATFDLCVLDLYQGVGILIKAGTAPTYIKNKHKTRRYEANSLPIGIVLESEFEAYHFIVGEETYIVMMTDGVLDMIPFDLREHYVEKFLNCIETKNPSEIAKELLNSIFHLQGEEAKDDMLVLVMGIWKQ